MYVTLLCIWCMTLWWKVCCVFHFSVNNFDCVFFKVKASSEALLMVLVSEVSVVGLAIILALVYHHVCLHSG